MKSPNGRYAELARIAEKGCVIEYADGGFIPPNHWISSAIIRDFQARGLIQREGNKATVTKKGKELLERKP